MHLKRSLLIFTFLCFLSVLIGLAVHFNQQISAPEESVPDTTPAADEGEAFDLQPSTEKQLAGSGSVTYAAGVNKLSSQQETLLKTYMDTWYQALGTLSDNSFTDVICDTEAAAFNQDCLTFQVEMRANETLDYSLTSYSYTLTCTDIEDNGDGTLTIRAEEDCTQRFTALQNVDSQRFDVFHMFTLKQVDGVWKIQRHIQPDTLFYLLYEGDDYYGEYTDEWALQEAEDLYRTKMPNYLARILSARKTYLADTGAVTLPTVDHTYNAAAALAYADTYVGSRSDDWGDYSDVGGNCQNYVSQCLNAGGIPEDVYGDDVWEWYSYSDYTVSWTVVGAFMDYAAYNNGYGLYALTDVPYTSGTAGDTLHVGTEDTWQHSTLISAPVRDAGGDIVDYLVYSNTGDLKNYPASLYGYSQFSIVKIVGWND